MALVAHAPSTVNEGAAACAVKTGLTHPYTGHCFDTFALMLGFLTGCGRGHDQGVLREGMRNVLGQRDRLMTRTVRGNYCTVSVPTRLSEKSDVWTGL
jgi:hypothetical protein